MIAYYENSYIPKFIWMVLCLCTLGFPDKCLERLEYFESLVPESKDPMKSTKPWSTPRVFSDRGDGSSLKTMRQKQQEEWDKMNFAISVITATSAAALAIQSTGRTPEQVYWVVSAFYSAAFGMSLIGLVLVTYITILAGGTSDEAIGRLAKGQMIKNQPVKPVAFIMSLPAIIAVYSSFALLAGLIVMIAQIPGPSVATRGGRYAIVAMIPIGGAFFSLCLTVLVCEGGTWIERRGRKRASESVSWKIDLEAARLPDLQEPKAPTFPVPTFYTIPSELAVSGGQ